MTTNNVIKKVYILNKKCTKSEMPHFLVTLSNDNGAIVNGIIISSESGLQVPFSQVSFMLEPHIPPPTYSAEEIYSDAVETLKEMYNVDFEIRPLKAFCQDEITLCKACFDAQPSFDAGKIELKQDMVQIARVTFVNNSYIKVLNRRH